MVDDVTFRVTDQSLLLVRATMICGSSSQAISSGSLRSTGHILSVLSGKRGVYIIVEQVSCVSNQLGGGGLFYCIE